MVDPLDLMKREIVSCKVVQIRHLHVMVLGIIWIYISKSMIQVLCLSVCRILSMSCYMLLDDLVHFLKISKTSFSVGFA